MMQKLPKYSALILAAVMLMSATVQAAGRVRPAVYMAKDFVVAVVIHPQQMASSSIVKALDIGDLPVCVVWIHVRQDSCTAHCPS